jgi:hypothetical protein
MNALLNGMAPQGNPKPPTFNEMLEKMQKTTPTNSVLSTLSNDLQQAQKGIPPQCQKELSIAFEDFAAKARLAEVTLTTMKKDGAKIPPMRQLHPAEMTQIAQNTFGPRAVQAEGEMVPSERPVVVAAKAPVEEKVEFIPFIPVAPSKPEPSKVIQESLTKPVEVSAVEQRPEPKSQPQPKTSYLFGPPPTKMIPGFAQQVGFQATPIQAVGSNERIRKILEEFMTHIYTSPEYEQALELQDQKKLLPLSLTTLHMHIYHAAANQQTMDALKPLFDECLGYSKKLVDLFAQEKPNGLEPDVQRLLDQAFAYILVCFDALAKASENGLPGVLTGWGSWFGGESSTVKQERVAHMLKLFSDPILLTIDLFYKNFGKYFVPDLQKEFDAGMFDVTKITHTLVKKVYPYGYGNVGSLHKKRYEKVIRGLYRAAGAPELEKESIVFDSPEMQKCWVTLQEIMTSLEQIVNTYDQEYGEDWRPADIEKEDLGTATLMFIEALDAWHCLQVPGQETAVEVIIKAVYEKVISLIDRILGETEWEEIEIKYKDALTLIEEIEKAIADVSIPAETYDKVTLEELEARLIKMEDVINPDKFNTLIEKIDTTLKWLNEGLEKREQQEKAQQEPTPITVPTPIQPPVKVEPKITLPARTEPEKKFVPVEAFVPEEEVEEELPQPSVIVPEVLQGPTAQDAIREALTKISKDIQLAPSISESQASEWLGLLLAIDQAPEVDEGNRALVSQTRDLLRTKLADIKARETEKQLNEFIAVLEKATQAIPNSDSATIENQMIATETLNTILTQYTDAKDKDIVPKELTTRLTKALKDYCIALVPKILLDATVDEAPTISIRTLHTTAFSEPQNIKQWGTVPTTILEGDEAQLLVYTLNRIKNANILIELDELDTVLAALCASFDACMAALYNSEKVAGIITKDLNIQLYIALLDKVVIAFSKDFSYIDIFITQYGNYCTTTVRDGYNEDNFDITTKLNGLSTVGVPEQPEAEQPEAEQPEQAANGGYRYAVEKDTEVNFGTFSVKVEKSLSSEHKKEYEKIPIEWKDRVAAHQTFADLKKKIGEGPKPNTKELTDYVTELEALQGLISDEEREALKASLTSNLTALERAKVELDALFAAFAEKIKEATGLLEKDVITIINFNAPYIEAKRLIAQHAELAVTYKPQLDNLVNIYKKYITEAVYTMIEATRLDKLHQEMYNKSTQVEAAHAFSLNLDMNRALTDMLNQLKQKALFGVDSTIDYQQPESQLLQKALFAGYAYILVAYDAAEASLYDAFSTVETITQWLKYFAGGDYKTLYNAAIKTMTYVVDRLEGLQGIYYREFLEPFFTDPISHIAMPGSYLALYDEGELSVLEFGLKKITDDGDYIYRRDGIPDIYKNASFSVLPIDALHKKDYKKRAQNWIDILNVIYRPELLEQKQKKTEKIIRDTLLNLPIDGKTLSHMHAENVVFALLNTSKGQGDYLTFIIDLLNSLENSFENNKVLLTNLAELREAKALKDIPEQLTRVFACICANFDACIFWAYEAAKNKKANRELLENAFEMIPLTVDAIGLCWDQYNGYFDNNGQQFDKGKFRVGDAADAMVLDKAGLPIGYRYAVIIESKVHINENHRKRYERIIQRWVKTLSPVSSQKPHPIFAGYMQESPPPMTEPSVEPQPVEPEAETKPEPAVKTEAVVPESVKPEQVVPVVAGQKIVVEPKLIPSEEEPIQLPIAQVEKPKIATSLWGPHIEPAEPVIPKIQQIAIPTKVESQNRKELLEQKKQKTLKIIRELLNLPINEKTLATMHGGQKSTVFNLLNTDQDEYIKFIEQLIRKLNNNDLSDNLKQLSDAGMIAGDIADQLTKTFACICANFDACIFWAYRTADKNEPQNTELIKKAFEVIVPSVFKAIDLCWKRYNAYLNDDGQKFAKRRFEVGTLAGAMVSAPLQTDWRPPEYRYLIATRQSVFSSQSPVNVTLNGVLLSVFIDDNHKKSYSAIIKRWTDALKSAPSQKPHSAFSEFTQKTSLPTIAKSIVEPKTKIQLPESSTTEE